MDDLLNLYSVLGDKTRLRILLLLKTRDLCVCEIFEALEMSQPRVSRQLALLKQGGYISDRRSGKWVIYSLDQTQQALRLKELLDLSINWIAEDPVFLEDQRKLTQANLGEAFMLKCCNSRKETK